MEIAYSLSIVLQSLQPLVIASIITFLSLLVAVRPFFKRPHKSNAPGSVVFVFGSSGAAAKESMSNAVAERQNGLSMMEQLVPEITTHALSYLDYPSLCRLSMTNSLMRKAANDDNVWKALYHKDFAREQRTVTPVNGWKAYYAATRAVMNVNAGFFNIIRDRSLQRMLGFWLDADYIKCVHASGEHFSGFNQVMMGWHRYFTFRALQGVDFHVTDVQARILTDIAWVTMKTYVDMDGAYNMTNVYEFHHGRWCLVHHHSSVAFTGGNMAHHIVN